MTGRFAWSGLFCADEPSNRISAIYDTAQIVWFLSPVPDRLCDIPVDTRLTPNRAQCALGDTALVARHDDYAIAASVFSLKDVFLAPPDELYADLVQYPSHIPAG